jgi:aromatic-amino-acid transaminase
MQTVDDRKKPRHSETDMVHVIAAHQARPSDDPIFALNREATQRREKGEPIINATVGSLLDDDARLSILPTAARVVREVPRDEWAAYAPIAGTPAFLKGVMDDLLASEPTLRAASLAVATPGGTGALRHAIANFLEPGQSLLTTSYYWGPYKTLTDEADRVLATFSMFNAEGALDVEALDRALREQVKAQGRVLLFLNDPCHNPTGYSMQPSEWRAVVGRLLAHAEQAPVTLLVDFAYAAYAAGDPRAVLKELAPLLGHVGLLFAWSASKTYTHYGLRVGALVGCFADEKERAMNCSRGGLAAITRLLVDPELAQACNAERDGFQAMLQARVKAFNAAAPGRKLVYPRYDGGFFVTVFHEDAFAKAVAMKSDGVFVVPQKGALRVALCSVAERDVDRLCASLAG